MIYCVDVEGNLLEFVVYFLDGQLTDGDDHCVSLSLKNFQGTIQWILTVQAKFLKGLVFE